MCLGEAGEGDAALEDGADGVDGVWRELGEIGDGLAADALALAPGLAEQDGRGAVAIGDGFDVEGHGRYMETTYSDNDFNTGRKSKSSEILHGNKNTHARGSGEIGTHCRESTYEREDMSNLREVQANCRFRGKVNSRSD